MKPDWPPYVIGVAPNGARRTRTDHAALPLTPEELAATACGCRDEGAAFIHLHVRDRNGGHTLDADAYRAAIDAIRAAAGSTIVIQMTTEAVGQYRAAEQMEAVRAVRPEAVSVAIRELVPDAAAEREAAAFFAWLAQERIVPQYILYSDDDVRRFNDLRSREVVPPARPFVLFVLGRYAVGQQSMPEDILPFLEAWRGDGHWMVCSFGERENACALTAAALGGHSRVGFENNMQLGDGSLAANNEALVAQARAGATVMGRTLADADTLREMFRDVAA